MGRTEEWVATAVSPLAAYDWGRGSLDGTGPSQPRSADRSRACDDSGIFFTFSSIRVGNNGAPEQSILPGLVVHACGRLMFFGVVWHFLPGRFADMNLLWYIVLD
jgi:hypothetical protein